MDDREFEYDVDLSFTGEQREYVEEVAGGLISHGIRVFYDQMVSGCVRSPELVGSTRPAKLEGGCFVRG